MTSALPQAAVAAPPVRAVRVTRSRRPTRWGALAGLAAVAVLAYLPYLVDAGVTAVLVNLFALLTMATMWNLLAGYAGLVSVGQQAFIGLGAYMVLVLAQQGFSPYAAIPLAAVGCAAVALPLSWLAFRLRGGYFAIATWVIADACELVISHFPTLGGGTGAALPGMLDIDPVLLTAYAYWASLAVAVIALGLTYLVLRGRVGLALTAIRDDETGAQSAGIRVSRTKRLVYLLAAAGCGAAGAILIVSQLNVQPNAAFSVQWSAEMIFVTVIGGIGTIEGPIVGTVLFFVLQQELAQYGAWYLIVLGGVAVVVALWSPRGLWGLLADRLHLRIFPVGYWLWPAAAPAERTAGERTTGKRTVEGGTANDDGLAGDRAEAGDDAPAEDDAAAEGA